MIASYLGIIWQYLGCNTQPQNSTISIYQAVLAFANCYVAVLKTPLLMVHPSLDRMRMPLDYNRDTSMEDIGMDIMANVHCLEVQYRYETGLQEL